MPCALPPVDQNVSQLGWGAGYFFPPRGTGAPVPHRGLDFMADAGAPVVAALEGTVVHVGRQLYGSPGARPGLDAWGHYVVIAHGPLPGDSRPVITRYAHLQSASSVRVGARVRAGDLLGYVGTSGQAPSSRDRPRLFFQVAWDSGDRYDRAGITVDPVEFFFAPLGVTKTGGTDPGPPLTPFEQTPAWGGQLQISPECAASTGMGAVANSGSGVQNPRYSRFGPTRLTHADLYRPSVYDENAHDTPFWTSVFYWSVVGALGATAMVATRALVRASGLGGLGKCPCDVNPKSRACIALSEKALKKAGGR